MVVRGSLEKHELQRICGMDFNLTKSIFDGETFGLADGDSDTNSRLIYSYAVVSKEQSTLLCIPYQQYVCIQSEFLKSELSVKVEALQQLECFQSMPAKDLIPLATLLTDKRFSNGDVMLKEGMPANKLYLMVKGSATIVKEEVVVRKKQQRPNGFADQPFSNCNSSTVSLIQPTTFASPSATRNRRSSSESSRTEPAISTSISYSPKTTRRSLTTTSTSSKM